MDRKFLKGLGVGIAIGLLAFFIGELIFTYDPDAEIVLTGEISNLETQLQSACGLKRYAPVSLRGITVGKVQKLELAGEPGHDFVKATFSVQNSKVNFIAKSNPDLGVPAEADKNYGYAQIGKEGSWGDSWLDIYPGRPDRVGHLQDGGLIRTVDCIR